MLFLLKKSAKIQEVKWKKCFGQLTNPRSHSWVSNFQFNCKIYPFCTNKCAPPPPPPPFPIPQKITPHFWSPTRPSSRHVLKCVSWRSTSKCETILWCLMGVDKIGAFFIISTGRKLSWLSYGLYMNLTALERGLLEKKIISSTRRNSLVFNSKHNLADLPSFQLYLFPLEKLNVNW